MALIALLFASPLSGFRFVALGRKVCVLWQRAR